MEVFLINSLSFPTIIYSFFCCVCFLLWILTIIGILGMDVGIDGCDGCDVGDFGHIGGDAPLASPHIHVDASDAPVPAQGVGILTRLGINGVPITIVASLLSLFGWCISYAVQSLLLASITAPIIYFSLAIVLLASSFVISTMITAQLCKPLRKVFRPHLATQKKHLIGKTVTVHSLAVTPTFGEAIYDEDGSSIYLKIRAEKKKAFTRGDKVVLIKFYADKDCYDIMSEVEFLTKSGAKT